MAKGNSESSTQTQQEVLRRLESEIMIVQGMYKRYLKLMMDHKMDLLSKVYYSNDVNILKKVGNTLLVLIKNYTKLLQDYARECLKSQAKDSCKLCWRSYRFNDSDSDSDKGAASSIIIQSGDTFY